MKNKMKGRGRRYWFNLGLFGLAAFSVFLVVSIARASYLSAANYLHPPRVNQPHNSSPETHGIPYQDLQLVTSDGIELAAWYTPSENGALILVAHGHGDIRSLDQHVLYAQNGYGVLSWDFRAHGESGGTLSTLGYQEALDVEAALEYALRQPGVVKIGAWGGSMGGAAVLEAAAKRTEIMAVVVDSTFPTLEDELRWVVNNKVFLPFMRFFAAKETGLQMELLRPVDRIREISPRPVLIIQGEADSVIPGDSALRLYLAAGDPRFLWLEAAVGHVGMYQAYPEAYEDRVVGFFDKYLLDANQ